MPKNNIQILKQKELMAHDRILIFDTFYNMLEGLEEYIEKSGNYPGFVNKRQVYKKTVPQGSNLSLNRAESLFRTQLLIFAGMEKPDFLCKKVKEEYYRWINAVGIDANNCPDEKLKHFLLEISNVIEGRDEKIINQTKDYLDNKEKTNPTNPWDMLKVFNAFQGPLDKNREQAELLKDKTHRDIKNESKFNSSAEHGQETFGQISKAVSSSHDDFHFFPQATSSGGGGSPPPSDDLDKVVQKVKNNPQDWNLDEIPTEINNLGGATKQEWVLINNKKARTNEYNQGGKLNFIGNPIYHWENFNAWQRFEIRQAKKEVQGDYLTNEEINWVIREVENNPSIWRIGTLEGCDCLIHSLAQGKNVKEIGTLIHDKQKFSNSNWVEINEVLRLNNQYQTALGKLKGEIPLERQETREALEIWANELEKKLVVKNIKQNIDKLEIRKEIVAYEHHGRTREGIAIILKGVKLNNSDYDQKTRELINQPGKVYKQDYFDEQEQAEINTAFTSYENRQIIESVKSNISSWKIEPTQGNDWLIHNSAQRVDSEIGNLLHPKQRFTDEEWTEIKNALNSRQSWGSQAVLNILPTNFGNRQNYSLAKTDSASLQPQKYNSNSIGSLGIVALISGAVILVGVIVYSVIKPKKIKKLK